MHSIFYDNTNGGAIRSPVSMLMSVMVLVSLSSRRLLQCWWLLR
jgi:hypothetical protein